MKPSLSITVSFFLYYLVESFRNQEVFKIIIDLKDFTEDTSLIMEIFLVSHLAFRPEATGRHKDCSQEESLERIRHSLIPENGLEYSLLVGPQITKLIINFLLIHKFLPFLLITPSFLSHIIRMMRRLGP